MRIVRPAVSPVKTVNSGRILKAAPGNLKQYDFRYIVYR